MVDVDTVMVLMSVSTLQLVKCSAIQRENTRNISIIRVTKVLVDAAVIWEKQYVCCKRRFEAPVICLLPKATQSP